MSKTDARKSVAFYHRLREPHRRLIRLAGMVPSSSGRSSFAYAALNRIVRIDRSEVAASLWSFACFFSLLCGYYVLRPLRDEMGVQGGVENLPWLFSATFAAMLAAAPLFGWAAARLPRRRLVPWTYLFFIANVLVFYALFAGGVAPPAVARALGADRRLRVRAFRAFFFE